MNLHREKNSEYYWKRYIRLKKIYNDLIVRGLPIDDKLNSTLWETLGKYCECMLKETK